MPNASVPLRNSYDCRDTFRWASSWSLTCLSLLRLMATTGHLFEEAIATCHSLGIAGKVAGNFHWVTSAVCTCWSAMRTHSCILSSTVPSLLSPALDRRGTFVECITADAVLQHGPTADTCDGVENQMLVQIDLLRYWKECTHLLECLSGKLKLAITGFMLLVLITTHPFHPDRHER